MGQGPNILYLDNISSGGKICKDAIPSLGEGLAPLGDGSADTGVRQDLFHMMDRITSTMDSDAAMADLKRELLSSLNSSIACTSFTGML